jgi:hypothetical protein
VVARNVPVEPALSRFVESQAPVVADVTLVLFVVLHVIPHLSELREGVNDNTKQNVVQDNLDQQEEGQIDSKLDYESLRVAVMDLFSVITDTATQD